MKQAPPLFLERPTLASPTPKTRYQGSKYKLLDWIWSSISDLSFETVLDAFGGSGCVSHYLKGAGKQVTYNDILRANYLCGLALVENDRQKLSEEDLSFILTRHSTVQYDDFIQRMFDEIYFTKEENIWLDMVAQNIPLLKNLYKRALAYYSVFQAAISKRPYNLFHRKNLYIRTADVRRSFGNKATWDKPFESHFREFADRANQAVFSNGKKCRALNKDVFQVREMFDLVYIDTPYISSRGVGVDYHAFYHFLEGLSDYKNWEGQIDFNSKHRTMKPVRTPWTRSKEIHRAFETLFARYAESTVVVSYRTDGIPKPDELASMLQQVKTKVVVHTLNGPYKYVLSKNNHSTEVLIIGTD